MKFKNLLLAGILSFGLFSLSVGQLYATDLTDIENVGKENKLIEVKQTPEQVQQLRSYFEKQGKPFPEGVTQVIVFTKEVSDSYLIGLFNDVGELKGMAEVPHQVIEDALGRSV